MIMGFGINSDDIWNFNETGFRIGIGQDQLVIAKQQQQLYLGHDRVYLLGFWTNYSWFEYGACTTLTEHAPLRKCGVSAPGTVDGLYSLAEFLQ
jgi:hypothetical protein